MIVELPIDDAYKAELAAAEWARRLGFSDAYADGAPGPDGGVDVKGSQCVGQVKYYASPVGNHELHALYGIAAKEGVVPLFFALSGYTRPAQEWAESAGMELYQYSIHGELFSATTSAHQRMISTNARLELYSSPGPEDGVTQSTNRSEYSISDNKVRQKLVDINQAKVTDENRRELRTRAELALRSATRPLPEIDAMASKGPFRDIGLASPYCSPSVLSRAAKEMGTENVSLRVAVASNTATPSSVLSFLLSSDPSEKVRRKAATNRSLNPETAHAILNDEPSSQVRIAYATRSDVPSSYKLEPRKFEGFVGSLPFASQALQGFKSPPPRPMQKAEGIPTRRNTKDQVEKVAKVIGRMLEWMAYIFIGLLAIAGLIEQDWIFVVLFVSVSLGLVFVVKKLVGAVYRLIDSYAS